MLAGSLLCSCTKALEGNDELVVEGWITQGTHPLVLIHKSYAPADPAHSGDTDDKTFEEIMEQQLIPWGRVAISDGSKEVVLTGRVNTQYTPPYTYTTTDIIGEVGKTYTITVDYRTYHATARSTILQPVPADSIVVTLDPTDKTSRVKVYLSHLPESSYYMVEYKEASQQQFNICPLGTASSQQAVDGVLTINVLSKGINYSSASSSFHYFETNDKEYVLRLIRIDREQYDYFTELGSQLATQGLFFTTTYRNLPSNLNGGIGYWAGFGKNDYHFYINRNNTYCY